jgi:hypothetical protein
MGMTDQGERPTLTSDSGAWLRRAWIAIALVPVFFMLAFGVGQGLYSLLGYLPESAGIPLWVDLVATVPTVAVFLVPCVAAVLYGKRVNHVGDRRGLVPLGIGGLIGIWMVVMNVVTIVSSHL